MTIYYFSCINNSTDTSIKKLLKKNTNYDIQTPFLCESIQLEILMKYRKHISLKKKFLLQKNMSTGNRIDMWENTSADSKINEFAKESEIN